MTVETNITVADYRAFVGYLARQGNPLVRILWIILFGLGFAAVLRLIGWIAEIEYHGPTMLITLFGFSVTMVSLFAFRSRSFAPSPDGLMLGRMCIVISPEGVLYSSDKQEGLYRWTLVQCIGETPDHIFIMLDRAAGLIIPRASFHTPQACGGFLAELRKHAT